MRFPPANSQSMMDLATRKRFGVVADEQQRDLSGMEFVQGLADGTLPLNSMAQTLGYEIVEVAKGRVAAAVEPHAGHLNPSGTVHGGLSATLLDTAMGLAIRTMLPCLEQLTLAIPPEEIEWSERRPGYSTMLEALPVTRRG